MTGDWLPFLPHAVLLAGGVLILGGALLSSRSAVWGTAGLLVIVAAAWCAFQIPGIVAETSPFVAAVNAAFLFAAGVLILGAWKAGPVGPSGGLRIADCGLRIGSSGSAALADSESEIRNPKSEIPPAGPVGPTRTSVHGFILCGVAFAMLTAIVDDAILLFAALEFTAFAATILTLPGEPGASATGVLRRASTLQLVSAALLLLALFLILFDQRTTNLPELQKRFTEAAQSGAATGVKTVPSRLARAAFVLVFAAVAVKAFLVPFHFGSPEFLTLSPPTACSYALVVSRGAALIVLFRVGLLTFAGLESAGLVVSAVLSGGTMLVGTALAVGRERLRDTLTYLLIGHGGTVLFGLSIAWGEMTIGGHASPPAFLARGEVAAGLALLAVSLSVLGIFALLNHLRTSDRPVEYVEELTGLLRDRPLVAVALAVLLLNLVGIPPLPGFWSRLLTTVSALAVTKQPADAFPAPHPAFLFLLAAMGIQILITAGVVFRIVAVTVFEPPLARSRAAGRLPPLLAGVACAAIVLGIGLMPSRTIAMLNGVIPQCGTVNLPARSAGSSRSVQRPGRQGFLADAAHIRAEAGSVRRGRHAPSRRLPLRDRSPRQARR